MTLVQLKNLLMIPNVVVADFLLISAALYANQNGIVVDNVKSSLGSSTNPSVNYCV
jgi:hypothetical protein